jgi:hypothetical protein
MTFFCVINIGLVLFCVSENRRDEQVPDGPAVPAVRKDADQADELFAHGRVQRASRPRLRSKVFPGLSPAAQAQQKPSNEGALARGCDRRRNPRERASR